MTKFEVALKGRGFHAVSALESLKASEAAEKLTNACCTVNARSTVEERPFGAAQSR
jgi:hypothetical protein